MYKLTFIGCHPPSPSPQNSTKIFFDTFFYVSTISKHVFEWPLCKAVTHGGAPNNLNAKPSLAGASNNLDAKLSLTGGTEKPFRCFDANYLLQIYHWNKIHRMQIRELKKGKGLKYISILEYWEHMTKNIIHSWLRIGELDPVLPAEERLKVPGVSQKGRLPHMLLQIWPQ